MPTASTESQFQANRAPTFIITLVLTIVLAFLASWPTLLNKQPFFFPDSAAYIRHGELAISYTIRLFHKPEPGDVLQSRPVPKGTPLNPGRSVYYGAFLETFHRIGGFAAVPVAQAFLLLLQIAMFFTYFGRFRPLVFGLIVIALAATTPFAFFNSFIMPDAFTGGVKGNARRIEPGIVAARALPRGRLRRRLQPAPQTRGWKISRWRSGDLGSVPSLFGGGCRSLCGSDPCKPARRGREHLRMPLSHTLTPSDLP